QIVLHGVDFIAHRRAIGDHLTRPSRHAFAFRRQSVEALPPSAQKNRDTELELELLDPAGETRLAHVTGPGRAPEVSLLGDCHQILELPQEHRSNPVIRLRSRTGWAPSGQGATFGGMIILTLEKAKTIDSINFATSAAGTE